MMGSTVSARKQPLGAKTGAGHDQGESEPSSVVPMPFQKDRKDQRIPGDAAA